MTRMLIFGSVLMFKAIIH